MKFVWSDQFSGWKLKLLVKMRKYTVAQTHPVKMAVTTQPRSNRKEAESFVKELDPQTVQDWSESEVVDNYLKPIGMEFMAKAFMENHITGAVLLALREEHIKELGCAVLGDRILFMEYLSLLKKHKRDLDRSKALWTAQTPVNSCAYHENCGKYLCYVVCRCCFPRYEWRVTGQGIRWRKTRAAIDCCGDVETQFIDYRFLKDLELRQQPRFCCCCIGKELLIYADDKDSVTTRQSAALVSQSDDQAPVSILHPDVNRAESIIRNAWADTKLVAD